MTAREIAEMMARTESKVLISDWQDLAGRFVGWMDRLIDSSALGRIIRGFLIFASGYFLGIFVNVLNR